MNEILNTNPLFFALSVFSLIFYDFSKDYKTLDYYYPKRFDIKANNIRQIEKILASKRSYASNFIAYPTIKINLLLITKFLNPFITDKFILSIKFL